MSLSKISFSLSSLNNEYQNNGLQPTTLVDLVLQRIENCTTPNIWIFKAPASDLQVRAQTLMVYQTMYATLFHFLEFLFA